MKDFKVYYDDDEEDILYLANKGEEEQSGVEFNEGKTLYVFLNQFLKGSGSKKKKSPTVKL